MTDRAVRFADSLWGSSILLSVAGRLRSIDRFHLPALDLLRHDVSAFAEQTDAKILWFILGGGSHGGLAIVGKHFHQILVDEDAQGEVFARLEFKRCLERFRPAVSCFPP